LVVPVVDGLLLRRNDRSGVGFQECRSIRVYVPSVDVTLLAALPNDGQVVDLGLRHGKRVAAWQVGVESGFFVE
jgi:hypothetical protein